MKRIPHLSIHLAVLAALSGVAHAANDDNANGGELTTVTVTARYETEDAHGDVQYAFETTVGTITPRLDLSYQSKQDWDPASGSRAALPQFTQPGYTVANAQLEYMPHDSKWTATAGVTNLTDKYYYYELFSGAQINIASNVAPPREYFLSVRRDF